MKIEQVLNQLHDENIDSMFLFKPENIKYLTDFYPSSYGYIIIKDDEPILYTSSIDKHTAEEQSEIETRDLLKLAEVKELLTGNVAVESSLDIGTLKRIVDKVDSVKISNVIEDNRQIKTKEEIQKIRESIKIAIHGIHQIDFTSTEKNAAATLEYDMTINGSIRPAFETIVASGARSSDPHSAASMNSVETPIVVDWGAQYDYYCSDITRTFIESERQQEIWDIVLEAQKAGIEAVSTDVKTADVDKAARDVIEEYGYGEYYIHSTGHSFGLEIHEPPFASYTSDEVLKENMVTTVEPGIYIPGEFGVRIEDDVLVQKKPEVLTGKLDKKLDFSLE